MALPRFQVASMVNRASLINSGNQPPSLSQVRFEARNKDSSTPNTASVTNTAGLRPSLPATSATVRRNNITVLTGSSQRCSSHAIDVVRAQASSAQSGIKKSSKISRPCLHATMMPMEIWLLQSAGVLLAWLALPQVGLPAVFLVALVSATLLPMGSEPAVAALVQAHPDLFWSTVLVATAGNTLGGAITWWMGHAAGKMAPQLQGRSAEARAVKWVSRFGAKACLLSWLPLVGDPLCGVAGWLRLPFWPCVAYMAVGKFARYALMTSVILGVLDRFLIP